MKKFTKILAGMAVITALALGAAAFAGCSQNNKTGGTDNNKVTAIDTAEEAYGFTAATAGMVIAGMQGGTAAGIMSAANDRLGWQVTDEETIATLNEYMQLVEGLLSEDNFVITATENDNAEYAYSYKMTAAYRDLNGQKVEYQTYYNRELLGSHADDDDEPWEQEVTDVYAVEGVMVIDGTAYPLEGRFVNETEGRESENTHRLKVTLDEANDDYLMVTLESENEDDESEEEYAYSLYRGGRLAERTTFEYESERGETEIKMTVSDRVNGTNSMFEFERETERGKEIIKIKTGGNGGGAEYIVRVETDANGNSQYVYYRGGDRVGRGERFDFDD